jgi:dihydroorotate dehydrogenase
LTARAQAFLERLAHLTNHRLPLIACGGLMTPDDAKRRLDAGASLVQLYTGLIYAGPTLPRRIVRALG